jgi:PEP-CTERM motif
MRNSIFWLTLVLAMGLFASTSAFVHDRDDKHPDKHKEHDRDQPWSVPEPSSIVMLGTGLPGVGALVRRNLGK